jgi:hypothetical protein
MLHMLSRNPDFRSSSLSSYDLLNVLGKDRVEDDNYIKATNKRILGRSKIADLLIQSELCN